jgi:DNA-binding response OmpR family regulator
MPPPLPVRLDGIRILLVEDEFLLAVTVEDDLTGAGATIVGPFSDLARARQGASAERFDVAVLDVNLNGTMVYPLADDLIARGVPFLFLSGYAAENMPPRFAGLYRLPKPYDSARLAAAIVRLLRPAP